MTHSLPASRPANRNGSPQKGGRPSGQKPPSNYGTLELPSFGATRSRKATPCRQLDNSKMDSVVIAVLLLFGNHLLLWLLLAGGALLFSQAMMMRDAVQILQYQRSVAPVLRND